MVTLADEMLATAMVRLIHLLGELEPWTRDAACKETPDVEFFIERGASSEPARAVCGRCAVRGECLDYALRIGTKHGVWGGLSERERRRVRRERALVA